MPCSGLTPCRWWVFDRWTDPVSLDRVPADTDPIWEAHYDNDIEHGKRTTRRVNELPRPFPLVFADLQYVTETWLWTELLGYPVTVDPTMHGGGLHVMAPGGWLCTHLDYARHPLLPDKERRLNLILFLNPEWRDEWGGAFILCDPMGRAAERIYPAPGRLVAFETDDNSYHGVEPITGPVERVTAAVYFLGDLRPGTSRQRALFMPNRGDKR